MTGENAPELSPVTGTKLETYAMTLATLIHERWQL